MRIAVVGVDPLAEQAQVNVSWGIHEHCSKPKVTGIVCAGADGAAGCALIFAAASRPDIERIALVHGRIGDLSWDALDAIKRAATMVRCVDPKVPLWRHALDFEARGLLAFRDGLGDVEDAIREAKRRKLPVRTVKAHRAGTRR